jgi:hypothetical protein
LHNQPKQLERDMETVIDWSKWPEDAELHLPNQQGTAECAVKFSESGSVFFAYSKNFGWTKWAGENKESLLSRFRYTSRTWTGEGLPPVGTVCEWAGCTFAPEDPKEPDLHIGDQVTIIAHFKDGEFDLAAFTFNPQIHNPDRGTAWVSQGSHGCFRTIRTPEQIEAEERKEFIENLAAELGGHWSEEAKLPHRSMATYLYYAGYRKQVQP